MMLIMMVVPIDADGFITGSFDLTIPNLYRPMDLVDHIQRCRQLNQVIKTIPKVDTHGIYFTAYSASSDTMIDWLIETAKSTSINAVVIDIKDDSGHLTIDSDDPLIRSIGSSIDIIDDIESIIQRLHDHGIYCIARIVTFKDPYLAMVRPDLALYKYDGSLYTDYSGLAWIDPSNTEVWDYIVACGKAAIDVGFDEIQFDYIRFTTEGKVNEIDYHGLDNADKMDVIIDALTYFRNQLKPYGVYLSADVFGAIIGSDIDQLAVGQNYVEMAKRLDYISPMIYPSHYGDGSFGLDHPDLYPYDVIYCALEKSNALLQPIKDSGEKVAVVRPWLQDFTASYLRHYQKNAPT